MDEHTKATVKKIPLLTVNAGPRDADLWVKRLKEEYAALIKFVQTNKDDDNDWFQLESNKNGTRWTGKCWYIYQYRKYEFDLEFDIPVTYPTTAPELQVPELDGLTPKMYRGGKICLTVHFKPLWSKNAPHFGIAHALALGVFQLERVSPQLAPWLAAEIPHLVDTGKIIHKEEVSSVKKVQG